MTPLALGAFTASVTLLVTSAVGSPVTARPDPVDPPGSPETSEAAWPVRPVTLVTDFADVSTYAPGHRGIDLATDVGQSVAAAQSGWVTVAGAVAGRPLVVIDHGRGVRTTYLPVDPQVVAGDHVDSGDLIGTIATSGHCVATSCLHWGARRGDRYFDPRVLLAPRSIVLLPLEP